MILARCEWTGAEEAKQRIEKRIFTLTGKDPEMFGKIQQVVYKSTSVNFASQGRPAWIERKFSYAWPILLKTGKLLDSTLASILIPWQHLSTSHLLNISSISYGIFHQYGQRQAVRRYVNVAPDEKKAITAILREYLRGKK